MNTPVRALQTCSRPRGGGLHERCKPLDVASTFYHTSPSGSERKPRAPGWIASRFVVPGPILYDLGRSCLGGRCSTPASPKERFRQGRGSAGSTGSTGSTSSKVRRRGIPQLPADSRPRRSTVPLLVDTGKAGNGVLDGSGTQVQEVRCTVAESRVSCRFSGPSLGGLSLSCGPYASLGAEPEGRVSTG